MRQTTPPDPPDSSDTKLRINSPVLTSHNLTVPSSELVTTKRELNCRQVTADWCLLGPKKTNDNCFNFKKRYRESYLTVSNKS